MKFVELTHLSGTAKIVVNVAHIVTMEDERENSRFAHCVLRMTNGEMVCVKESAQAILARI